MKKLILLLVIALFSGLNASETLAQKKGNSIVCFKSDMDCLQCEKTVTEYLKFEKGVKDLKVDHASNTILVEYKEGKNTDEKLAAAIKKKGYKAEKITIKQYDELIEHIHEHGHEHNHEVHRERK
ncbi:heavy-metal-associated domain-containing protein [uncultured Draconibacterium sp.]|uniref:heavy-metal-associated domain-containing protein n=1 Tax=uncultured Draconibacterium sp. TaxID=1573823 RepID=UPI0025E29D8B|nr:heavy-metal-associated domain-containing protein [uncultured Draconibacterium sp.]